MESNNRLLQYKRGIWYIKAFQAPTPFVGKGFLAMANTVGFPETVMDHLETDAWFAVGDTEVEACEALETKLADMWGEPWGDARKETIQ